MDTSIKLLTFITESNMIEGINRPPTAEEIDAHVVFLEHRWLSVKKFQDFVKVVAPNKILRDRSGYDVRVGSYEAPKGGALIPTQLNQIIIDIPTQSPYILHQRYERLHPFMDGNGRSGRIFWLWCMQLNDRYNEAMSRSFLHTWYYQSLQHDLHRIGED